MAPKKLSAKDLIKACADDGFDGGITIETELQPLAGPGSPVKPAVYEGGQYQSDRRWTGEGEDRRPVDVVIIDNVPSQANRLEQALKVQRENLALPEIMLDLRGHVLPAHIPEYMSSFLFPHRQADAYIRDAELDGKAFGQTDAGSQLLMSTATRPNALLQWFPQALLFGFWQSHYGKKAKTQARLARSWVSEIVGFEPASTTTKTFGLKGDPLNLNVDDKVVFDVNDTSGWTTSAEAVRDTKDKGKKTDKLSNIGHGQVPFTREQDTAPASISFRNIVQQSTCSFASLRRIHADTPDASSKARALLAALGIAAHVAAFGQAFSLRSGAELRPSAASWTWLGASGDEVMVAPSFGEASDVLAECVAKANEAGLPVGNPHWQTLVLTPNQELAKVIRSTYPTAE